MDSMPGVKTPERVGWSSRASERCGAIADVVGMTVFFRGGQWALGARSHLDSKKRKPDYTRACTRGGKTLRRVDLGAVEGASENTRFALVVFGAGGRILQLRLDQLAQPMPEPVNRDRERVAA